ncbi:MAG: UDP-2,3-diacylglucosamine diphosphatase LpxI [Planctomycetes bacterium]|nr:UDP-2,3-diacylglucosamine diphosphatase LpxI [Planctomycetota bacterium]
MILPGPVSVPFGAGATVAFDEREPVGLLACAGRFPVVFAEKARECGIPVVCVAAAGMADPVLKDICAEFTWLRRMSMGKTIRCFRRGGVRRWTMAGKFEKRLLMRPWWWYRFLPDWRVIRFWLARRGRANNDDSLLLGLINEFRRDGLECVSALDLCPELLVKEGTLTRRAPSAAELQDIQIGWHLAREMGRLDVGQSVMVRGRAVLAVEAIEGTDQAIARAGELCRRGGFVVVKVAKPQQDRRFDVPTVGVQTIETMRAAGATALAIEAGRTILLDEKETVDRADRYGITITSLVAPAV